MLQIEPTPENENKPRKSHLNIAPITVRPKTFKEEPTRVVVKQHSLDVTYGRIESTPTYTLNRAVTSENPRDDIVIEEKSPEGEGRILKQAFEKETLEEPKEGGISDLRKTIDGFTSIHKVKQSSNV